jgi:DME family drug/metabolite transporter
MAATETDTTPVGTPLGTPGEADAEHRAYLIGLACVAGAGLVWSFGHLTFRMVEVEDPWAQIAYRWFLVAPLMMGMIAARYRGAADTAIREGGLPVVLTGVFLAVSSIAYVVAISHTTIANVLFVVAAAPMFAAILARVVLGEPIRPATLIAFPFVMIGITVMVGGAVMGGSILGNVLALVCGLGYAAFSVTIRMRRTADTRVSAIYAALIVSAVGLAMMTRETIAATDVMWLAAGGLWQLGLGYVLFAYGARWVPAAQLLFLGMIETVMAPIWLWLFFGEVPLNATLIGGGIILAAVILQALPGARRKPLGLKPR